MSFGKVLRCLVMERTGHRPLVGSPDSKFGNVREQKLHIWPSADFVFHSEAMNGKF